jgi:hypothetical protein
MKLAQQIEKVCTGCIRTNLNDDNTAKLCHACVRSFQGRTDQVYPDNYEKRKAK